MIIGIVKLLAFKRNAGIEDTFDALFREILYVPVYQFGRIADRIRRNGLHSLFKHGMTGRIGKYNTESEFRKHRMPKRVIFINIQGARYADRSVDCFFLAQGGIVEHPFQFILKQIRHIVFSYDTAPFFAAVSRYEFPSVLKRRNGQHAAVLAFTAPCKASFIGKPFQLFRRQNTRALANHFLFGKQRRAECSHELCNVRPHNFTAELKLKRAQNSVIFKSTALHHDIFSKISRVFYFDDLI